MKSKTRTLAVLVLFVALLTVVVPLPALAAGNNIYVSGTLQELLPPPPEFPPDTGRFLGNGKYQGLEWTLNKDEFSDPRLSGDETIQFHYIVDLNTGSGICWGTNEIVNDGGSWSGHLSGRLSGPLDNLTITTHETLVGRGAYKGLVASLDATGHPGHIFQITGYIVETGANQ
jgi:hypothetical protein